MARAAVAPLRQSYSSRPWFLSHSATATAAHLSSLFTTRPRVPHPSLSDPIRCRFFSASPFAAAGRTHDPRRSSPPPAGDDSRDYSETDGDTDGALIKKSRNEMKREARRAVQWGMELAAFSEPQIKRILRVASLEKEVFDAIMLVKRFGPDVREGRRRQFNYIGRLLRTAQPELMDALIQASKDGDNDRLLALSGQKTWSVEDDEEDETNHDEGYENYIETATRWFDGLINKDPSITNEVYSVHSVEFDRQELRKLVRRVQSTQGGSLVDEGGVGNNAMLTRAKKPLIRFLNSLAKKSLAE